MRTFKIFLVIVLTVSAYASTSVAEAKRQVASFLPHVEQQVRIAFARTPIMVKIAKCESGFRQHDGRGKLLRNKHSTATGAFQVMYSLHHRTARRLGLDIKTTKGNIAYAKHLYRTKGTRPWKASRHCWG